MIPTGILLCLLSLAYPLLTDASAPMNATTYTWWLMRWADDQIACTITIPHDDRPSAQEIDQQCGNEPASKASLVVACEAASLGEDKSGCEGYYLLFVSKQSATPISEIQIHDPVWKRPAGTSSWLQSPPDSGSLATDRPLALLAGNLISSGLVSAGECPENGLLANGTANSCGEQQARPAVIYWQNQFDDLILQASHKAQVPPAFLKNIFARESQFWPSSLQASSGESGLGHLTVAGADTLLKWNREFYAQFCPRVIERANCQGGYANLSGNNQAMLRGAVVRSVRADCSTCPGGIDLEVARQSIPIFAHTLLAKARQVDQILYNLTGRPALSSTSFEDLWRFAAVSYNAGPMCLYSALEKSLKESRSTSWEVVRKNFSPGCARASDYVASVAATYLPQNGSELSSIQPPVELLRFLSSPPSEVENSVLLAPESSSVHGGFSAESGKCAQCHSMHTAQRSDLTFSSLEGNDFCYSCHDGSGAALRMVSSHSNIDRPGVEEPFELLCTQCHSPHGSSNLFAIRLEILLTASPRLEGGLITFVSRTGLNSFDDGESNPVTRLCLSCHTNPSNPGYPMVNHEGAAGHLDGSDRSGQDCTDCHKHSADNDLFTKDGFMP